MSNENNFNLTTSLPRKCSIISKDQASSSALHTEATRLLDDLEDESWEITSTTSTSISTSSFSPSPSIDYDASETILESSFPTFRKYTFKRQDGSASLPSPNSPTLPTSTSLSTPLTSPTSPSTPPSSLPRTFTVKEFTRPRPSLSGKCTIGCLVRSSSSNQLHFLKFQWLTNESLRRMIDVYEKISKDGNDHELLGMIDELWHSETNFGTLCGVLNEGTGEGKILVVTLTSEVYQSLYSVKIPTEMLKIQVDIIKALRALYKIGYFHRDVSFGNVLVKSTPLGIRGILNDFDNISPIELDRVYEKHIITGTTPYLAMDILRNQSRKYQFTQIKWYDIESMFYVTLVRSFLLGKEDFPDRVRLAAAKKIYTSWAEGGDRALDSKSFLFNPWVDPQAWLKRVVNKDWSLTLLPVLLQFREFYAIVFIKGNYKERRDVEYDDIIEELEKLI